MKLWIELKRWYLGASERLAAKRRARAAKQLYAAREAKEQKLAVERLVGLGGGPF